MADRSFDRMMSGRMSVAAQHKPSYAADPVRHTAQLATTYAAYRVVGVSYVLIFVGILLLFANAATARIFGGLLLASGAVLTATVMRRMSMENRYFKEGPR